jgi:hypothetical protein
MVVAIEPMINMGTKHQTTERWLDNSDCRWKVPILSMMLLLLMGNLKYYPLCISSIRIVSNEEMSSEYL